MSNLLNEQYRTWLMQYKANCDHPAIKKIASELIKALPKTKEIQDLRKLLCQYINPQGDDVQLTQPTLYGPINFYAQLLAWQTELKNIEQDRPKALRIVRAIPKTPITEPLVAFLSTVLSKPKMLLHYKMPSLLTEIHAKNFPEVLNFIIDLSKIPVPESTKLESYPHLTQDIPVHQDLLLLLHKVSAQALKKNELGIQANNLLQSTLAIYQEMQLIEVSLEDDADLQLGKGSAKDCVIL